MIATRGNGPYACGVHLAVERLDLLDLLREVEAVGEPNIAEVRDPAQIVGIQLESEIERPHETRGIADLPRPVPRSRTIRDAEIGRYADEPDIDLSERARQWCTHKRCYLRIARLFHRIVFAIAEDIRTDIALIGHA